MASPTLSIHLPTYSTVKELLSSGALTSVPPYYVSRNPTETDPEAPIVEEEIPVIDLALLTGGSLDERSKIVHDLGMACKDWGFFMVVNHGVPEGLRAAMLDVAQEFFNLGEEEKRQHTGKHVLDPIRCGTSFNTSVDEVRFWRDFVKIVVHPEFHFPEKPPRFREVAHEYSRSMREMGKQVLKGIWDSLGVDASHIEKTLGLNACFQVLVANLYLPCPQPELAMGMPPHSDHGLLTMLLQNGIDGLQVKHNGSWILVKPRPNSFLVNIGDHMEIVSNGRYKSVLHRAEVNTMSTRMSIPTVIAPSLEAVVLPAAQLAGDVPAFHGMQYKEYLELQQGSKLKDKSILDLLRLGAQG